MRPSDLFRLKVDLLTKGVRGRLKLLRNGGGGPIGGVCFKIDDCVINAPYTQDFAKSSSYSIEVNVDGNISKLLKNNRFVSNVFMPEEPQYYKLRIDGIEMRKIVALDGVDTLVTSVLRYCSHKRKCYFCSLEHGEAVREKNPNQIAKVVEKAVEEDSKRHLVVTTGTPPTPDKGALLIAEVVKAVKEAVDIPIQVQIEPPKKPEFVNVLYEAGADSISLNVETFDLRIRRKVVPEKPSIEEYIKCWKHSLNLFGEMNVSSWLLVGLGETFESLISGCSLLCEIGVLPFIVPYRPVNNRMCDSKLLMEIYIKTVEIMKNFGISPKGRAGCMRCYACSAMDVAFKV